MASSDEFLANGKRVLEYVVQYMNDIENHPVVPSVRPGYLQERLPETAPEKPESFDQIMQDIKEGIMPGLFNYSSPHFHGYYPLGNSYPSILADILSNGFCQFPIAWQNGPAATELEMVMMNWLAKMINLPKEFQFQETGTGGGFIQGTASEACLIAMMAAKAKSVFEHQEKYPDQNITMSKLLDKFVMYTSKQSHSMCKRTALMSNVQLRLLDVDKDQRLRGPTLEAEVKKDLEKGLIPLFVVGTLGTTSCCSFDDLKELGPVSKKYGLWLHIDAAYAGAGFICPEFQHFLDGVEFAESFCFNPYKWMMVNFDCSTIWFKDTSHFISAYNDDPVYLKHKKYGIFPDFHHWEVPLGHRMRSLKLWFVIRMFGVEGLQAFIRKHVQLAKSFEEKILSNPLFEISAPTHMGLVCFRLAGQSNDKNKDLVHEINTRKKIFLCPCQLDGNIVIRFVITTQDTEERHIQHAYEAICEAAEKVLQKKSFKTIAKNIATGLQIINEMKMMHIDEEFDPEHNRMYDEAFE